MVKYKRCWQENLVFAADLAAVAASYAASYFIRFDGVPPQQYLNVFLRMLPLVILFRAASSVYFKIHKSIWKYASISDLKQIIKAASAGSVLILLAGVMLHQGHPRSIYFIDWLMVVISLSGMRFLIRLTRPLRYPDTTNDAPSKNVLVIGATDAGEKIIREIIYNYSNEYSVAGIVDDTASNQGRRIHGVPVIGKIKDIAQLVKSKSIQEIVIASAPALSADMRFLVEQCAKSGVKYRIVPNFSNLINGTVEVKDLREVRLEDLLRREEVALPGGDALGYINGKTVLVTGAGGSIGSELCRQIARNRPRAVVLYEKSENNLFYIDNELGQFFSGINKIPIIGDVVDRRMLSEIFNTHRPDIVFHAAAYKHVPLMEQNPFEAVRNNVLGTAVLAEVSASYGTDVFVMLSTDKAADPINYMGVSKRAAELFVAHMNTNSKTKFMSVRFGNVLNSEGSVIPTFKRQIEKRMPITVTHPEITRYFMTIPEASGLVLQAGAMGLGGEIFVLEMGTQIKILDLALDLIKLSGLEPYKDIDIVFTGLRPGEKMCEKLIGEFECVEQTSNPQIMVLRPKNQVLENFSGSFRVLEGAVIDKDFDKMNRELARIAGNFKLSEQNKIEPAQNPASSEMDLARKS